MALLMRFAEEKGVYSMFVCFCGGGVGREGVGVKRFYQSKLLFKANRCKSQEDDHGALRE